MTTREEIVAEWRDILRGRLAQALGDELYGHVDPTDAKLWATACGLADAALSVIADESPHGDTPQELVGWLVWAIEKWPDPRDSEAYLRARDWLAAHHGTAPTTTQATAASRPHTKPASDATRGEGG